MSIDGKDQRQTGDAAPDPATPYQRVVTAAARQLGDQGSLPTLTASAEIAGVPVETALRMFADDIALCLAVAEDMLVRMNDFIAHRGSTVRGADPADQYAATMKGFIEWCNANPRDAAILLLHNLPEPCRRGFVRHTDALGLLWRRMLNRAESGGRLRPGITAEVAHFQGRVVLLGIGRLLAGVGNDFVASGLDRQRVFQLSQQMLAQHLAAIFNRNDDAGDQPQI